MKRPPAARSPTAHPRPNRRGRCRRRRRGRPRRTEAPAAAPSRRPPLPSNKHWYVVKVQSGREESIKEAIERRVKIEGLEEYFGQIIIPIEKVTEMRNGKRVVTRAQALSRLLDGRGGVQRPHPLPVPRDFRRRRFRRRQPSTTPPPPMSDHEVEQMLGRQGELSRQAGPRQAEVRQGDRVKVKDGTFAGMEGEVKEMLEAKGMVRVELTIFGRPVPVELEYWQVDHADDTRPVASLR